MVFRSFLGNNFFLVGPPPVGNGDLAVFSPILGLGHLEKFGARAENRKTQFAGARGPKTGGKSYHAVRDGCPQLSFGLRFDGPDPEGRENAKYEDFRPFWPRTAVGTLRNPRIGPKNRKSQFPGAGGTEIKKILPRYPGRFSATYLHFTFWTTGRGIGCVRSCGACWRFWQSTCTALSDWSSRGLHAPLKPSLSAMMV